MLPIFISVGQFLSDLGQNSAKLCAQLPPSYATRHKSRRFLTASELQASGDGRIARACGIVTVRQRPATAKGTVFITLEDETGPINVIVWPDLVERYRMEVYQSGLLAVYGKWQSQKGVMHLVSKMLVDQTHLLGQLALRSRDFC